MTTARLDAARAFGALLASEHGRRHLRARGHRPGRPIVLADDFEHMALVIDRLRRHTEARTVLLGVYFSGADRLEFLTVGPCEVSASEQVSGEDTGPVDRRTQVGMLVYFMKTRPNRPFVIRLTHWDPYIGIKSEEPVAIDG